HSFPTRRSSDLTVLRSTFHWEGLDQPEQWVNASVRLKVEEQDWRGAKLESEGDPKKDKSERLEEWLDQDRKRGFDLTQAPLMRVTLFRLADHKYRLVWTFHHLLLDARAIGMVIK